MSIYLEKYFSGKIPVMPPDTTNLWRYSGDNLWRVASMDEWNSLATANNFRLQIVDLACAESFRDGKK